MMQCANSLKWYYVKCGYNKHCLKLVWVCACMCASMRVCVGGGLPHRSNKGYCDILVDSKVGQQRQNEGMAEPHSWITWINKY